MKDLKNKTALITGSSRGIGQQIAMGLAKLGCNIILHGRTDRSCDASGELLKDYPVKVWRVYGELADKESVMALIERVHNLQTNIDILYNNAAIMIPFKQNYWEHSWEEWTETFKVNVMSMYDLCGAFIPGMIERGFGRVINLSSGIKNTPELVPYGASKWAVNKMTEEIAYRLKGTGVRINTLDPGWLQTDMGGENADHPVEAVLPGALAPALIDNDGPNGIQFSAIDHDLKISS